MWLRFMACTALVAVIWLAKGTIHTASAADAASDAAGLKALKDAGLKAELTLYPVQVLGRADANVAQALGLVLESYGMEAHDVADAGFTPAPEATWEARCTAFGDFVRERKAKGSALYAEYLGEPRQGPTEVRWVIVDAGGQVLISDRQTPKDPDFKRTAARDPDPMGCSMLVGERLFGQLGWKKGARPENGRFAQRWAEKSGTPNEAERTAIKQRAEKLRKELAQVKLGVYPTRCDKTTDAASAGRIAQQAATELKCQAVALEPAVAIEIAPTSNEQKRLWDLARGLREYVRAHPPETDYVLLADYLVDPAGGRPAGCVHFVLCDKAGDWVVVDFQNNQHADFQQVKPRSIEDCDRLAVLRLAQALR